MTVHSQGGGISTLGGTVTFIGSHILGNKAVWVSSLVQPSLQSLVSQCMQQPATLLRSLAFSGSETTPLIRASRIKPACALYVPYS